MNQACASGRRSMRRRSWALAATTMVDTLIRMAPTAGARMPAHAAGERGDDARLDAGG